MSDRLDGGPAFPIIATAESDATGYANYGMSLRDWFAGQVIGHLFDAVSGMGREAIKLADGFDKVALKEISDALKVLEASIPGQAYEFADAMLKEREKGQQ